MKRLNVPMPPHYHGDPLRCVFCKKKSHDGYCYGEHFLCDGCSDDGDALALVAYRATIEPDAEVIVTDDASELTEEERELLKDTIRDCSLDDAFLSPSDRALASGLSLLGRAMAPSALQVPPDRS